MNYSHPVATLVISVVCLALLCSPVTGASQQITRTIPSHPAGAGELVTVTLTVPPSFFGAIVETLPEGFSFEGTSHPDDAVKQAGQTVIFALTGEEAITYTVRMPDAGCGYLNGQWGDFGAKTSGTIPATLLATPSADLSSCAGVQQSSGFGIMAALLAVCVISGCICLTGRCV